MATSREEVQIKLGVDARSVSYGLTGVSGMFGKFVSDTRNKLMSLARANIYIAAADLARQLIPTAEEFWNKFYGVDSESTKAYEEQNKRLHKLRDELRATQKTAESALRDLFFSRADPRAQQEILFGEAKDATKRRQEAEKELDFLKRAKASVEDRAKAQANINKARTDEIQAQQKLEEFTRKLSPDDTQKQFESRRNAIAEQVFRDRGAVRDYQNALEMGGFSEERMAELKRRADEARRRISQAVEGQNVQTIANAGGMLAGMPFGLGQAGDAMKAAMVGAMQETIIKVNIVDIQEP